MNLNTVMSRLVPWYQSGTCVYLTSAPGRGKSETIEGAAALIGKALGKNLGVVVVNGGNLTTMDAIGFGLPVHLPATDKTAAYSIMRFSDPFFWVTDEGKRLSELDGGILYIDEADKMATEVKKIMGEGALSGRFGPHRLPPGWVVWMSGNRTKDRSGATKELDHLINRRMQIEITDDLDSLMTWMEANEITPLVKAFTKTNPQIVFTEGVPEKQGPWCTPRSLVKADRYLQLLAKHNGNAKTPDDPTTIEEVAGMIGDGAAAQLFAFIKLEAEMPTYESIVKDPKGVKVPGKPDAQMLVVYSLAHRIKPDDADSVVTYVRRFPKEFGATFAHSAASRDFKLLQTAAFRDWVKDNSSLLTSMAIK